MTDQIVLLESRTMRSALGSRVAVLDKVKALQLLPDGVHVTARMAADYFEVGHEAVYKLVQRHRAELEANGLVVLRGPDLQRFELDNLSSSADGYPQGRARLTLLSRRTVLNTAMLLRDSDVARRVRTYLLDIEDAARSASSVERRTLELHAELIGAMSVRLTHLQTAVEDLSEKVEALRQEVAELRIDRGLELRRRRKGRG